MEKETEGTQGFYSNRGRARQGRKRRQRFLLMVLDSSVLQHISLFSYNYSLSVLQAPGVRSKDYSHVIRLPATAFRQRSVSASAQRGKPHEDASPAPSQALRRTQSDHASKRSRSHPREPHEPAVPTADKRTWWDLKSICSGLVFLLLPFAALPRCGTRFGNRWTQRAPPLQFSARHGRGHAGREISAHGPFLTRAAPRQG